MFIRGMILVLATMMSTTPVFAHVDSHGAFNLVDKLVHFFLSPDHSLLILLSVMVLLIILTIQKMMR